MPTFEGLFKRFPNVFFIETGTFRGDAVRSAIWEGFPVIISIEKAEYYFDYCQVIFNQFPNVHLLLGDSGELLKEVMAIVNVPATFWLDAHYSWQNTTKGPSPLFKELEAINSHEVKTHSILIDDISDYSIDEVKIALSNYKHFDQIKNILICQP